MLNSKTRATRKRENTTYENALSICQKTFWTPADKETDWIVRSLAV